MMTFRRFTNTHKTSLSIILVITAFFLLSYAVYNYLPVEENANPPYSAGWGVDWKNTVRPGSLDLLAGKTPYTEVYRCLPPWIYLLVSPIALLPQGLGTAIMFVLTFMVYSFVLFRLKANPWVILAFMFSSYVFSNAKNGNLDFLAVLGFILPPQIGLFFVLLKPQIGIGIAIFWLFEAWREGRARKVITIFSPIILAYIISFVIYGLWPLKVMGMVEDPFNASLWPIGIIVGLVLLVKGIKDRNGSYALAASPFLAPYVNATSYAVVLFPFIPHTILFLIGVALSWR